MNDNNFKNPWEITPKQLANPWEVGNGRSVLDRQNNPASQKDNKIVNLQLQSKNQVFIDKIFAGLQSLTNKKLALLDNGAIVFHNVNLKGIKISGMNVKGTTAGTVLIDKILNSKHKVMIYETSGNNYTKPNNAKLSKHFAPPEGSGTGESVSVFYNAQLKGDDILNEDNSTGRSPFIGLCHEMLHAKKIVYGEVNPAFYQCKIPVFTENPSNFLISYLTMEEIETRTEENVLRKELSEKSRKLPIVVRLATYIEVKDFLKKQFEFQPELLENAIPKQNKQNK